MIKTLKSELKLKPTYDELVGMIEDADKENRPPIDKIIDRRATLFRNNQFGSQLDNIDFLGLKKQEEDRAKEDVRQAQLRQTAISTGSSMGILTSSGFTTPAEAYDMDDDDDMTSEEAIRIRAEIERYLQRQQQAQQTSSSTARSDLDVAHRQSLPVGMNIDEEEDASADASRGSRDMPPLETPIEIAEEDEEGDEDEELIPDDEMKTPSRKHKTTIDYNDNIKRLRNTDVSADDIMFQLYLRGITLEKKQEDEMDRLKTKGQGKTLTKKDYLLYFVEKLIHTGQWTNEVNDQLLKSRTEEWKQMKGKGKGSGSASSSSGLNTIKDIAVSGAKAGVETLAKAGATALAKSFLPV